MSQRFSLAYNQFDEDIPPYAIVGLLYNCLNRSNLTYNANPDYPPGDDHPVSFTDSPRRLDDDGMYVPYIERFRSILERRDVPSNPFVRFTDDELLDYSDIGSHRGTRFNPFITYDGQHGVSGDIILPSPWQNAPMLAAVGPDGIRAKSTGYITTDWPALVRIKPNDIDRVRPGIGVGHGTYRWQKFLDKDNNQYQWDGHYNPDGSFTALGVDRELFLALVAPRRCVGAGERMVIYGNDQIVILDPEWDNQLDDIDPYFVGNAEALIPMENYDHISVATDGGMERVNISTGSVGDVYSIKVARRGMYQVGFNVTTYSGPYDYSVAGSSLSPIVSAYVVIMGPQYTEFTIEQYGILASNTTSQTPTATGTAMVTAQHSDIGIGFESWVTLSKVFLVDLEKDMTLSMKVRSHRHKNLGFKHRSLWVTRISEWKMGGDGKVTDDTRASQHNLWTG